MRKRLLAVSLCLALLPLQAMAQRPGRASAQGPRMEILSLDYDFGKMFHQDKYVHSFVVHNAGTEDLVIKDVSPSCGCTAAKFDHVIPPGGDGQIELAIDGNKVAGEFNKSASVISNDPVRPHIRLTLAGHEIPYVDVEPTGTVTLHGRLGEPVEQDLTISSNEPNLDFKVLGVTSNIDDKMTYVLENGANPHEYTLKLYRNPKLPSLSTYGELFIRSNSTGAPVTRVQVHVQTRGSIDLSPTVLNYGDLKFAEGAVAPKPTTKTVTVSRTGGQLEITEVSVSNPNYRAVVDPVTPGQQYRVHVTFSPPARTPGKQTEAGELVIHTNDPQEPTVRVQLIARAL